VTSRERVIKTLEFQKPDRVPRCIWALPGVELYRKPELDEVIRMFPMDFASPDASFGAGNRRRGVRGELGFWTDDWGCVRETRKAGVGGESVEWPLDDWSKLDSFKPPWEMIENADFSRANKSCAESDKFMMMSPLVHPFERMQFLHGTERLFLDLAYGTGEMFKLLEIVHDFNIKCIEMCAATDADAVQFLDDWGSQTSLLISPDMWREIFKPLYKDYCDIIRGSGKYVFYHSDGYIEPIYNDLIEIGVNAINSQVFCMDIEELGRKYAGRIVFWGEIDRQHVLPFGTRDEVAAAVKRVAGNLRYNGSGVIAQCEWGVEDPMENIVAVYEAWEKVV